MKLLSSIMAMLVFALATLPCCLEDDCICASCAEIYGSCRCGGIMDGDDCCDDERLPESPAIPYGCCSPFVSCNTCTGVTEPHVFLIPAMSSFLIHDLTLSFTVDKAVEGFHGSVWQPPRKG